MKKEATMPNLFLRNRCQARALGDCICVFSFSIFSMSRFKATKIGNVSQNKCDFTKLSQPWQNLFMKGTSQPLDSFCRFTLQGLCHEIRSLSAIEGPFCEAPHTATAYCMRQPTPR